MFWSAAGALYINDLFVEPIEKITRTLRLYSTSQEHHLHAAKRRRVPVHCTEAELLPPSCETAADKERDRGAAFLGRDTEALHTRSGCLLLPAAENSCATP
ncbi:hypothetical protein Y032_0463g1914 [Ancylostoma ceylanicum]|nr:hypothetical protein Y032_0463g1914 [Ancylostoma ceylanicum]